VKFRVGNEEIVPPLRSKYEKQPLRPGDVFFASSPGGGGFGDPLERPAEAVEQDLNLGYVSRKTQNASTASSLPSKKLLVSTRDIGRSRGNGGNRMGMKSGLQERAAMAGAVSEQRRRLGAAARVPCHPGDGQALHARRDPPAEEPLPHDATKLPDTC